MAYASRFGRGYLSGFNAPTFTGTPTFANGFTVSAGTAAFGSATVTGISGRYIVGPWMLNNVGASLTNAVTTSFVIGNGAILRSWKAPRACSITAATMFINTLNATPAGTLTLSIFVDGVDAGSDYDLVLTPATNADQGTTATFGTAIAITAGQVVDIRITTTGDWNSTTGDVSEHIEVEQASV